MYVFITNGYGGAPPIKKILSSFKDVRYTNDYNRYWVIAVHLLFGDWQIFSSTDMFKKYVGSISSDHKSSNSTRDMMWDGGITHSYFHPLPLPQGLHKCLELGRVIVRFGFFIHGEVYIVYFFVIQFALFGEFDYWVITAKKFQLRWPIAWTSRSSMKMPTKVNESGEPIGPAPSPSFQPLFLL